MKTKLGAVLLAASAMSGCAYNVQVTPQNGSSEVMSTKVSTGRAYVVISDNLATLGKDVKPGFVCRAHSYPLYIGNAVSSSILQTLAGAYGDVKPSGANMPSNADGVVFRFDVADFDPVLRFQQGFFTGTADATVDLAIRARVTDASCKELAVATLRGQGHDSEEGSCPVGADALSRASGKALRSAMENMVDKLVNTDILKPSVRPK